MNVSSNTPHQARLIAVDMMKTLAIFFMILAHVVIMYGTPAAIYSDFSLGLAFVAEGIGAPAFIFAMGLSVVLASKKTAYQIGMRGLLLFVGGYVLNFLKFYPTAKWFKTLPVSLFADMGLTDNATGLWSFLGIADILQFAAIAYVICAFLHRYVDKLIGVGMLVTLLFFVGAPYLYREGVSPDNYFLQLLYGKSQRVYFALLPWLGFAISGMAVGDFIKKQANLPEHWPLYLAIAGMGMILLGLGLILNDFEFYFGSDYYHRGTGALIMYMGQLLLSLSLYHRVSKYTPGALRDFFAYCSKNVTAIYVIQWVLIYWCWCFIPYASQPWSSLWLLVVWFSALTLGLVFCIQQLMRINK
ncbi:heparan-alpha-glucosaminide N-acetyltransferase domain-containing protein [Flavobacterium sp. JP2137]|uniref:heparan-alpha-glucosaminide N-acetyltransferase domain-containing protein n=1 Tax=Flavobacterium sp. JP2137 TaxID=3414510 RepID=UPI003D2FF3D5